MFTTISEVTDHHNAQVTPDFRLPYCGMDVLLASGDVIGTIDRHTKPVRISERIIGDSYSVWIALVRLAPKPHRHDYYAVYALVARPEGWHCESGVYCSDREDGLTAFAKRVG